MDEKRISIGFLYIACKIRDKIFGTNQMNQEKLHRTIKRCAAFDHYYESFIFSQRD